MKHTFLRRGDHPAQSSDSSRDSNDPIEGDATAQMQLNRVGRRDDKVVIQRVLCCVYKQRVVDERQDDDGRRDHLAVKDVLIAQLQVARVQTDLQGP